MQHSLNPFFQFSVTHYQHVPLKKACHQLQDEWGANVNILLFCCWSGQYGIKLTAEIIQQLVKQINGCDPIVQNLRKLRQRLKTADEDDINMVFMREEIKEAELMAERIEQNLLYNTCANLVGDQVEADVGCQLAVCNLMAYCRSLGIINRSILSSVFLGILEDIFVGLTPEVLNRFIDECLVAD